jgi:phospholipase B1, membrane-associated
MAPRYANPNISVENDWKLLSIFIGANDLCASCTFASGFLDPEEFEQHLFATLERVMSEYIDHLKCNLLFSLKVRQNVPKVFVNLVSMFNLSQVYDLSQKSNYCKDVHR